MTHSPISNNLKSGSFSKKREFPLTKKNFDLISQLTFDTSGIQLDYQKEDMVYVRLAARIKVLGLHDFNEYCDLISHKKDGEYTHFINSVTTNLTSFFREPHHFEHLLKLLIQMKRDNTREKRIRIWSAGCSKGMEPYSIAMTILKASFKPEYDIKVLATDLDTTVLKIASKGLYNEDQMKGVDKADKNRFFNVQPKNHSQIKDRVKDLIAFKPLNLMEPWPINGPFDIIFCRNVVIYFNKDTQRVLFDRFADLIAPRGTLFIGHSETLQGVTQRFDNQGRTIYRKRD